MDARRVEVNAAVDGEGAGVVQPVGLVASPVQK